MREHLTAYRSTWLEVTGMTEATWRARFDAQIRHDPAPAHMADRGPCWTSTAYRMPNGYTLFWLDGAKRYTHRVAYEHLVGPIPDGLDVDHLCRNRACCNPAHLEAVTHRVNTLRGESFAAAKAQQTECVNGHRFDDANTYVAPNGTRKCRTCRHRARLASRLRVAVRTT